MDLPVMPPVAPMLAKSVKEIPDVGHVEPKWDGFRTIVFRDGDEVELGSRNEKPMTRYFPELVESIKANTPERCVLDGEIIIVTGDRLDFEALQQRIHPAATRVKLLSEQTPASFVAFDVLALDDEDLTQTPFAERRRRLEAALKDAKAPVHVTPATSDLAEAKQWFTQFEGAGLDGVVAKPLTQPYAPNKRTMFKIKHARTADVVALGYRIHKSGQGVGSLLVGLYTAEGTLMGVGGVAAWSNERRLSLIDELAPYVERDDAGDAVTGETDRSRFSASKDVSFVRLRPERVLEVRYDQLEGYRFRHTVQFERWRDDREARSCTYEQLETVSAYDLGDVLD